MAQRVLFTCGGSAGHINPGIALAGMFRSRRPETEILFVGAKNSIEEQLIPRAGYEMRSILISGFWRGFGPQTIKHNIRAARLVMTVGREVCPSSKRWRKKAVTVTATEHSKSTSHATDFFRGKPNSRI